MAKYTKLLAILAVLACFGIANAANDTGSNNVRIDTFGADVEIASGRVQIKSIIITAYSSAKTITFIDSSNAKVMVLECPSGYSINWTPSEPVTFYNGIKFDDSASDLAANDFIFVFKK
jgi:hypothetical protein